MDEKEGLLGRLRQVIHEIDTEVEVGIAMKYPELRICPNRTCPAKNKAIKCSAMEISKDTNIPLEYLLTHFSESDIQEWISVWHCPAILGLAKK
jgi:hypothetical protein